MRSRIGFKCHVGLHEYTGKVYLNGEYCGDRCRSCGRSRPQSATRHQWSRTATGPCSRLDKCLGCGYETAHDDHSWSPSQYVAQGSCDTKVVCSRCQVKRSYGQQHQWSEDRHIEHPCIWQHRCERCGIVEKSNRYPAHKFGSWEYTHPPDARVDRPCEAKEVCAVCGQENSDYTHHSWENTYYKHRDGGGWVSSRACSRCGYAEEEYEGWTTY
jgi:hypothetical protein